MEDIIQKNNAPAPATLNPAMKRARLFITAALVLQLLSWIAFGFFQFHILEYLDWNYQTYGNLTTIPYVLINLLLIVGFIQFCFTGNRLYRVAGIVMTVGYVISFALPGILAAFFGIYRTPYTIFIYQLFSIFGLSALWIAGNGTAHKTLIAIAALYLFSFGYNIMSTNLESYLEYSNPLAYFLQAFHDNGTAYTQVHVIYILIYIAELILWWRFCRAATPEADRSDVGFVQILLSRPFVSYIVCGIILILTLNFFSQQIFLS